jgi:hypothetical protein
MMKNIILGLMIAVTSTVFAGEIGSQNCYQKYAKKFEERGANDVPDGWDEDVVVTFRQGSNADCLMGKVKVEKGVITQIYLRNTDGSYEIYNKQFKHATKATVTNGISKTLVTVDDILVNVIFRKSIKPPKKQITVAPDPDDL